MTQVVKASIPYTDLLAKVATRYSLPVELLRHQVYRESAFNPKAVSKKGAVGLMQLLPSTAAAVGARHHLPTEPLTDPEVNMNLGAAYMRELLDVAFRYTTDPRKAYEGALVGYFAGPARISKVLSGAPMTKAERSYVDKVIWDFKDWHLIKPTGLKDKEIAVTIAEPEKKSNWWWLLALAGAGLVIFGEPKKRKRR